VHHAEEIEILMEVAAAELRAHAALGREILRREADRVEEGDLIR